MKLNVYLNSENNRLSIESLAILGLIDYCDLHEHLQIHFDDSSNSLVNDVTLPAIVKQLPINLSLIYTGLASVYRVLIKYKIEIDPENKHFFVKLLGYKSACLKACSEVSKWTHLCEIVPVELLRTGRVNVFKQEFMNAIEDILIKPLSLANKKSVRTKRSRYLEDFHVNISDLLCYFYIQLYLKHELLDKTRYKSIVEWLEVMKNDERIEKFDYSISKYTPIAISDDIPIENQFEYLSLNSKEVEVNQKIDDLKNIYEEYSLKTEYLYETNNIKLNWNRLDDQVNPLAGKLPLNRNERKCQQLENFAFLIKKFNFDSIQNDFTIVDFCSGGGHLGILIAYLYPNSKIKLIDNKEESLELGAERISRLGLKNIAVYKGNLNNFKGKFDLGLAIHACGTATDLIIDKCIQSNASIFISPCCYGSIKSSGRIKYPRSRDFCPNLSYDQLINFADRTEKDKKYEEYGYLAMNLVDTDRLLFLKQVHNYKMVYLTKLLPETCTTKNNFLIALSNESHEHFAIK